MVRRSAGIGCAVVLLFLLATPWAFGQQTDPKVWEEIQALKKGQEEIRKQLQEILQFLQARQGAPAPDVRKVAFDLGDHPIKGNSNARLTLVEFSDYQCPFCARHVRDTDPLLKKEYVETGKLRYVFFDMPLESIHALAFKAAEASRCAGEQGRYWEMHDRLYASQQALEPWSAHAKALGLEAAKFDGCMSSGKFAGAIRGDMATAQKLGINSTPTFLVAVADPSDPTKVRGLTLIRGAQPFGTFKMEIDKALAADGTEK